MKTENQLQVQTAALTGATIISALHSAKSLVQVFIGQDNVSTRMSNWSTASMQKSYLGAISKRVQFFTGSDSMSTRITQLFKGFLTGAASIVMCDLITTNSSDNAKFQTQNDQLSIINIAAHDAKDVAGAYIDACCTENNCENVANLIDCMAKAFSGIQEKLVSANNSLQTCNTLKKGLDSQIKLNSDLLDTCNSEKTTALSDAQTAQETVKSQESEIADLKQQIDALTVNINEANATNSNNSMTIDSLREQTREVEALKQKVNKLEPSNSQLTNQVEILEASIETLKTQHTDALEAANVNARAELDAKQAKLDACYSAKQEKEEVVERPKS